MKKIAIVASTTLLLFGCSSVYPGNTITCPQEVVIQAVGSNGPPSRVGHNTPSGYSFGYMPGLSQEARYDDVEGRPTGGQTSRYKAAHAGYRYGLRPHGILSQNQQNQTSTDLQEGNRLPFIGAINSVNHNGFKCIYASGSGGQQIDPGNGVTLKTTDYCTFRVPCTFIHQRNVTNPSSGLCLSANAGDCAVTVN